MVNNERMDMFVDIVKKKKMINSQQTNILASGGLITNVLPDDFVQVASDLPSPQAFMVYLVLLGTYSRTRSLTSSKSSMYHIRSCLPHKHACLQ